MITYDKRFHLNETRTKMSRSFRPPYTDIDKLISIINNGDTVLLEDHLAGFDCNHSNQILTILNEKVYKRTEIKYGQILEDSIKNKYSNLNIGFEFTTQNVFLWQPLGTYTQHPKVHYKNFICSFNGSAHVSRQLLVSILEKFKYYDPGYCSKNFSYSTDTIDGHIINYMPDQDTLYRKFFVSADSEYFFQSINSFGNIRYAHDDSVRHIQYAHDTNIYNLENKLTESFLHIVSETMATSYVPFVTEKFLYSIVTRGLFLSYAQPGWHAHIEKYYGFKLYTKLFDYRFDSIQNPIERLVELITMISKFSKLSYADLYDIYLMELDTINYNYDHYFSGDYIKKLKEYE